MKTLLFFIAILLVSCGPSKEELERRMITASDIEVSYSLGVSVLRVDKCEYVLYQGPHGGCIIHKANCKNH
jgi:hypothetical protein